MATMTADAGNAGATGTALLTLRKVGRVELPRITKIYRDALAGLDGARNADVAGSGEVFALWARVCDELRGVLVLSARRTEAAGEAVCRAIAEYTGADADGRNSSAVAGQELWRKINDPWEVDPEDPEQNPPPAPPRGTAQDDPCGPDADAGAAVAPAPAAATPEPHRCRPEWGSSRTSIVERQGVLCACLEPAIISGLRVLSRPLTVGGCC